MDTFTHPLCVALRAHALSLPETSEGSSCVNRAFKVRKKNFLFVGEKPDQLRVMLKLTHSLDHARGLQDPRIDVGKTGWVTVRCPPDAPLATDLLQGWVDESFRALAPRTVLRQLPDTA